MFLTSTFARVSSELKELIPEPFGSLTVAFIPTAADTHDNKSFVDADRSKLEEMGFNIIDVPLAQLDVAQLTQILDGVDIIFVAGGNTFYLLQEARKSGFVDVVPKLVEKGIVYIGSSAGSYLACPTIEVAHWKHQDRNIVNLTDLTALSLVPFLMSVHYKPEFEMSLREAMRKTSLPLKILTDEQALIIQDNNIKLVGIGSQVKLN